MHRIAFELDRAAVASFRDQSATGGALTTRRREVGRDARDGVVRRDEIGDELLDVFLKAADSRRGGARGAQDLEEVPALDARGPRGLGHVS